jgi:hypothetical protein
MTGERRVVPGINVTKLVTQYPDARPALEEHFGRETVARLLDLEREMEALLARLFPDADVDRRSSHAALLAYAIATDSSWFAGLMQPRPAKIAKALDNIQKAALALSKAVDELPPAAVFGMHMRLLELDLPPPAMRQVLARELVHRTMENVDAGLNSRKAAVAEIAVAATETRSGIRSAGAGKHRADRLARRAADAFEDLTGRLATVSGTGEGIYPDLVAVVLEMAGLRDVSAPDAARREAERRRDAALHSGDNDRDRAKISTRRCTKT